MSTKQKHLLTETLWTQSRTYNFDPLLIIAVMQLESRSNPLARGRFRSGTESGAFGLMQVKLGTAKMMGRTLGIEIHSEADLMKPDVNLLLGSFYLLRQIIRYGDVSRGLMAYNIGPGELAKRLRTGERLPLVYSRSILVEYQRLITQFGLK
jgi:soluble lytic murein transglycosylase-like protein